jgi:hypothetical protein
VLEEEVDALLEAAGLTVRRIAGENRYETAALVAAEVIGTGKHVFLVNGDSPWDALAIGPVAAAEGIPVLLTKAGALRDETKAFLVDNGIKTVTILGGEKAVSAAARAQIPASIAVKRVFGENRDETSLDVAEEFFGDLDTVVIASRASFADALVGGYFAALVDAPILLVGDKKINDWIDEYLLGQVDLEDIYILGGEAVISKAMAEELDGYDVIKSIEPIPNQVLAPTTGQLKFLVNGKWPMTAAEFNDEFGDAYGLTFLYTPGSVAMADPAAGAAGSSMGKGKYAVSVTETATGVKVPAEGALAENAVEYVVSNPKAIAKVTKFVMTWGGLPNVVGKVANLDVLSGLTPVAVEAVTVGGTTVTAADTSLYEEGTWPTFSAGWVGSTFPEVIAIDTTPAIVNPGGSTTLSFRFTGLPELQRWSVYVEKAARVATSVANKNYSVFTYDAKTFDLCDATSPDKIVLLDQYGEPIAANGQYVKITNKAKTEVFQADAINNATGLDFMNVADTFTVTVYPGDPAIPANSKPLGSYTIKTVPQGNAVPKIELDFVPASLGAPLYKELVLNTLPSSYVKFDVVDELHVGINVTVNGLPISADDVQHVDGVEGVNFTIESSDELVATVASETIDIDNLYDPIKVEAVTKAGATTLTLKGTASDQTSTLAMLTVKAKDVTPKINELEIVTRKLEISIPGDIDEVADQLYSPDLAKYTTYGFGEVHADMIKSAALYSGGDYLFVRIVMEKVYGGKTFEIRAKLVEETP